jgi:alkylation response protein AidB-like acyl-CoA dehydrogenase
MDLSFSPEEREFQAQVRRFLAEKLPQSLADKVRSRRRLSKADMEQWHAILNAQGWLASPWPREFGGPGWTPAQRFIFEHECALAWAPRILPFGIHMLGPVLIKFGTEAQKRHWLPRILDGRDWWCQGYSEPESGSDLASVKTLAVRQGDHYVVQGQKTWTTLGHWANMIFCLVRTRREGKPQEGISFLLIDMRSPGVEVRPIATLDGDQEIAEVFFTDVKVPLENLVGGENQGWTCAKYLLTHERTNIAGVGFAVAALLRLKDVAARVRKNGKPLAEDPLFAARMARVEIDLENMKTTNLRVMAAAHGAPGAESSMLKIRGTEIRQEISSLLRAAMGPYAPLGLGESDGEELSGVGPPEAAFAAAEYFNNRKLSIYGGSNEIQRNIISKMILGL